jgi:hypothetical protein
MSTTPRSQSVPWSRNAPTRTGPNRNAGGMYRTAEGKEPRTGGVPLNTANAAVVAAVRLAYEVAETQIARSTRLARRLRDAADQEVGQHSDRKALDATQRLVQNALMSGLEWWEGSVADGRCPVKRLAAAEYQMIGSILGFTPAPHGTKASARDVAGSPAKAATAQGASAERKPPGGMRQLKVVLRGEKRHRRHVRVEAWEITSPKGLDSTLFFHCAEQAEAEPISAHLEVGSAGAFALVIETPQNAHAGRWTCAVWDAGDVQVGYIEILL